MKRQSPPSPHGRIKVGRRYRDRWGGYPPQRSVAYFLLVGGGLLPLEPLPLEPLPLVPLPLVPLPLVLEPLPLVPLEPLPLEPLPLVPLLLVPLPLVLEPLPLPLPMPLLLLELDGGEEAGVLVEEDGCLAHAVNSMAAASALRATFIFIDGTPVE